MGATKQFQCGGGICGVVLSKRLHAPGRVLGLWSRPEDPCWSIKVNASGRGLTSQLLAGSLARRRTKKTAHINRCMDLNNSGSDSAADSLVFGSL